ncbi:MAG: YerC/YecD family TrpR-related protein [Gemmiger sp.]|nr:YerC/YecD family TrpR-related protein [Gemmiger sp.]
MRAETTNGDERSLALYRAILRLESLDECVRFFDDLCAVTELRTMEQRYDVACCLTEGQVYAEIRRDTGASSATVSRVNRMLNYGTGTVAAHVRHDLAEAGKLKPQK